MARVYAMLIKGGRLTLEEVMAKQLNDTLKRQIKELVEAETN